MNRCIHCTRCVRFSEEVAGSSFLGTLSRGRSTEIGSYIVQEYVNDFSANVIDLCPVGALTSKPYSYLARAWELTSVESIDILDATGINVRLDVHLGYVVRILPRVGAVNEWLPDRSRYIYDSFYKSRLYSPKVAFSLESLSFY